MTFLWFMLLVIEWELRKAYYGFVEKNYYVSYIKANLITSFLATIVEATGLYVFLVWMINPKKTILYYLYEKTDLSIFEKLYTAFGISAPEEYYYYVICTTLAVTSYNVFYMLIYRKDKLSEWQN